MKAFGKQAAGLRRERMIASPRWVEGGFRNLHPIAPNLKSGAMPSIGEFLCPTGRRTPRAPLPSVDPRAAWNRAPETGLRATWLGHSTVLIEIDGARVLTDPVWGARVSPVGFAGPKRFQPVPIAVSGLPELDAVIISHDHYDHLDYPTIVELAKRDVPFVTSLGVGAHLESWGVPAERIIELDWWESHAIGGLTITAAPSQHFSGRSPGARNATLWSSFAVRGSRHAFFFSGDTGLTSEYEAIAQKLGPFDLVMLEVGAFHPAWGDIHLGPENALEAYRLLGSGRFLPVHWGTFNLAIHDWDEPADTLIALAPKKNVELMMPRLGEAIEPVRAGGVEAWWRDLAVEEKSRERLAPEPSPSEQDAAPLAWPID